MNINDLDKDEYCKDEPMPWPEWKALKPKPTRDPDHDLPSGDTARQIHLDAREKELEALKVKLDRRGWELTVRETSVAKAEVEWTEKLAVVRAKLKDMQETEALADAMMQKDG